MVTTPHSQDTIFVRAKPRRGDQGDEGVGVRAAVSFTCDRAGFVRGPSAIERGAVKILRCVVLLWAHPRERRGIASLEDVTRAAIRAL